MKPRHLLLLMLWVMLMPVVLSLAVIALDDHPTVKIVVLVLGIGATIALPVLIDRRDKRLADVFSPPPAHLEANGSTAFASHLNHDHDEAGWQDLRKALWRDIEAIADEHGVMVDNLYSKEKWGRLRMRVRVVGEDTAAREAADTEIRALIDAAGDRSEDTCIRCGQPATTGKLNGRILPLCPEHRPAEETLRGEVHLFIEKWEESTRDPVLGVTVRPDGYSVHRSLGAMEDFVNTYWASMPDKVAGGEPDIYSRLRGDHAQVAVAPGHPLDVALADRDSLRLFPWVEETKSAYSAVVALWTDEAAARLAHGTRRGQYAEISAPAVDRPDTEASDLSLDEIAEAQAWLLDRMGCKPLNIPPAKPAEVDFIALADQARASGKWADMEALWAAVFALEHWHFVSAEAPHAGDYAPYCETAEDGKTVFVMAFTDGNLAMSYSPHLLEDSQRKVVPLFALDFETAIHRLHGLREQGVFGLLFNHPISGFYAPLVNLIPQYEYYRHRLPEWFDGVDGFDDIVRATGGVFSGPVPAMLLSMREWVFLADPDQPAAPLARAVDGHPALLAFTSDAQAELAARQLELPTATLLRWPPKEALAWMPALTAGGVNSVLFNLASERLTVAGPELADSAKRPTSP